MYKKTNGIYYELIQNPSSTENLVFIHGSGCNHKFLRPLAKELKDFNCYLLDLPDHCKSDNKNCTNVEDYIAAVTEFVSALQNVTIIGHSLGGTICLGIAAKNLPSVKKNIIISSAAKFDKFDKRIINMVKNKKVDWLYLLKCCGSYLSLTMWLSLFNFEPSNVIIKDFDIDIRLDLCDVMEKINIPTLILVGKDDILALPEYSTLINYGIKDSKLITIPNVRHMLPVAKRIQVSNLIREFI